jgi:hypothetical protein
MTRGSSHPERISGIEKLIPWIGALTVIIAIPVSDDPVNVWKFLVILCSVGVLLGFLSLQENRRYLGSKVTRISVAVFLFSMIIPLTFSGAPILQQLYGVSGRLTGFFSLASLSLLFLITSSGLQLNTYKKILLGVIFAGTYNLVLSVFENVGIEPLKFDNTYRVPLGSLGNPNFMSAFLAIFVIVSVALAFDKSFSKKFRSYILIQIPVALFELTKVGSKQGFYVVAAGLFVIAFVLIRPKLPTALTYVFQLAGLGLAGLVAAGFLNKGPLAAIVYKETAQFRYEYWMAGLRMARDHIFTGVGLNSYGDWFREYRSSNSIISPGKDVSTNVSHNVFIDYLATGGILHFLAYVCLNIIVLGTAHKYLQNTKMFDPIFTALFAGWVSYQIQALISVDNLALAIWSWLFGGSIIGYAKVMQIRSDLDLQSKSGDNPSKTKGRMATIDNSGKAIVFGFVGFLTMFLIATPVVKASIDWRNALLSRQVENIVTVGKQWPDDEVRLIKAVGLLINNQQNQIALDLATSQISKYPRSVALRYYIIQNPLAPQNLKSKMKFENNALDPLNPDWK